MQNERTCQADPEDIFTDMTDFYPKEDVCDPLKLPGL